MQILQSHLLRCFVSNVCDTNTRVPFVGQALMNEQGNEEWLEPFCGLRPFWRPFSLCSRVQSTECTQAVRSIPGTSMTGRWICRNHIPPPVAPTFSLSPHYLTNLSCRLTKRTFQVHIRNEGECAGAASRRGGGYGIPVLCIQGIHAWPVELW